MSRVARQQTRRAAVRLWRTLNDCLTRPDSGPRVELAQNGGEAELAILRLLTDRNAALPRTLRRHLARLAGGHSLSVRQGRTLQGKLAAWELSRLPLRIADAPL